MFESPLCNCTGDWANDAETQINNTDQELILGGEGKKGVISVPFRLFCR